MAFRQEAFCAVLGVLGQNDTEHTERGVVLDVLGQNDTEHTEHTGRGTEYLWTGISI